MPLFLASSSFFETGCLKANKISPNSFSSSFISASYLTHSSKNTDLSFTPSMCRYISSAVNDRIGAIQRLIIFNNFKHTLWQDFLANPVLWDVYNLSFTISR